MFKKLDIFLLKSYLGPFILTFCIALFVLDMMFLWKYVDDLIGKGVEPFILAELMFFASAVQIPMAFPLAVLVASIMTFGNLGEQFELTSVKAAGVSLFRFMRPLIVFSFILAIAAFYFSNNILPYANYKFTNLLSDIAKQKPALNFEEKIFNNDIDKFSIRINRKAENNKKVYEILIYDHTENKGNNHVITADSAIFGYLNNGSIMTITLFNGKQYKEDKEIRDKSINSKFMITSFRKWEKHFDLSDFKLDREDDMNFARVHRMLNLKQLQLGVDSVNVDIKKEYDVLFNKLSQYFPLTLVDIDTLNYSLYKPFDADEAFSKLNKKDRIKTVQYAKTRLKNQQSLVHARKEILKFKNRDKVQYYVYMHQKFTLSVACIVLFFIGAPLGSIVKKGGFGWPMLMAILFFVVYIVSSIIGEKTAEQLVVTPWQGMWLSTALLLPVGIFLTYKAMNDSPIFTGEFYRKILHYSKFKKYREAS